jgi:hypothetical protein
MIGTPGYMAPEQADAAFRDSFLEAVPDHARILEMARAWLPDRSVTSP